MKTILKTFNDDLEMKYDEKFMSETNKDIMQRITSRLIEAMHPRYNPTYKQINKWLAALHKHRRVRFLYKQRDTLDKNNWQLHKNNRMNEIN
jgi:hypothetical protein